MVVPVTTRIANRKKGNFPVNQEVALNADGSGGPIMKKSCWKDYKRKPGTKKGTKGSCIKK